jgi:hypothetical protein
VSGTISRFIRSLEERTNAVYAENFWKRRACNKAGLGLIMFCAESEVERNFEYRLSPPTEWTLFAHHHNAPKEKFVDISSGDRKANSMCFNNILLMIISNEKKNSLKRV